MNRKGSLTGKMLCARHPRMARTLMSRGFTYVELLVLIAVVCILMAMFLPALQGTLRTAQLNVCLNNQKSIALAFSTYFDDFHGYMPPSWGKQGHNLCDGNSDGNSVVNLGVFYPLGYLSDAAVIFCPAHSYTKDKLPKTAEIMEAKYQTGSMAPEQCYSTYVERGPTDSTISGVLRDYKSNWVNRVATSMTTRSATASRRDGNMPGGLFVWGFDQVNGDPYAKLRSPRAIVMCALPIADWSYNPEVHNRLAFNILYVDGTAQTLKIQPGMNWMNPISVWDYLFIEADKYYPGFQRPQIISNGATWTSYANSLFY